jgi:hypothetical protein
MTSQPNEREQQMSMTREYTNRMLDIVSDGGVDKDDLIKGLLYYISESEVKDFALSEGYLDDDSDEDDDSDDEGEEGEPVSDESTAET